MATFVAFLGASCVMIRSMMIPTLRLIKVSVRSAAARDATVMTVAPHMPRNIGQTLSRSHLVALFARPFSISVQDARTGDAIDGWKLMPESRGVT